MIVKFFDLTKHIKSKINFFLFYGANKGLIDEVINKNFTPIFNNNIIHYEESEILKNVEVFHEEILNKSFFDNNKLIIINRISEKILRIIEELVEQNIGETKIVLKTNILEKKSKLRNFFEKNKKTVITPFYEDNDQTLFVIAQNFFKDKKIKISSENINLIIGRSKGDRINLKNELEKIENFSLSKTSINLDEIMRLTNLAENYNISELVDHCLAKNTKKTLKILNENNSSSEDNILIIKTFLFKLKRLKKLKTDYEINKNLENTLASHKPPIFWKDKDLIKQQLNILSLQQIVKLTKKVNNLELLIKKNSQLSTLITNNFLLENCQN